MITTKLDVGIIGGGLAGNFLARQLKRTFPELRIGIFEKNESTTFKVGESTVEVAANYLIRRIGLSGYLYDQHLPKNGLRFFFDRSDKSARIIDMSEIGGDSLPFHPSFQIDRSRLEADLQRINAENGVEVYSCAKVQRLSLQKNQTRGAGHRLQIQRGRDLYNFTCRWVVDASGRTSFLARQLGLRVPEHEHPLAAAWGRFRGVADMDSFGPEVFRKRVRYTSRMLSTNHFCYPGYWIWFIPIGRGIFSVGVVTEHSAAWSEGLRKERHFLDFLSSHAAVRSLLQHASMIDIQAYGHLAYSTQRFFSGDRWGITGEAAAFTDPFYSPGSDFIALENDFITALISHDLRGESLAALHDLADLYNRYMAFRYEANMRLYRRLYSTLGSFLLFRIKWQLDLSLYYHLWLSEYMQDSHLDENFLRQQLAEGPGVLNALANFSDMMLKVDQRLRERGEYYKANTGSFSHALQGIDFIEEVGSPQNLHVSLKRLNEILNCIRFSLLDLLGEGKSDSSRRRIPLSQFLVRQQLD